MKLSLDHFVLTPNFGYMLNFISIPSFVHTQVTFPSIRLWVSSASVMCEVNRHHLLGDLYLNGKLIQSPEEFVVSKNTSQTKLD